MSKEILKKIIFIIIIILLVFLIYVYITRLSIHKSSIQEGNTNESVDNTNNIHKYSLNEYDLDIYFPSIYEEKYYIKNEDDIEKVFPDLLEKYFEEYENDLDSKRREAEAEGKNFQKEEVISADDFFKNHKFKFYEKTEYSEEETRYEIREYYKDVEINNTISIITNNENGEIKYFTGLLIYFDDDIDTKPAISEEQALKKCMDYLDISNSDHINIKKKFVIFKDSENPYAVFSYDCYCGTRFGTVSIDAMSGEIAGYNNYIMY